MATDYGVYAKQIAVSLLGEAPQRKGKDWRYGTHGSLAIDIESGQWYDHENETGGGPLDLIMREAGRSTLKAAISWLEEQGIKPKDAPEAPKQRSQITETYDYVDEQGELRYQVCRMEPKSFRQRVPKDEGGWSWSVKGVEALPYRLPDMRAKPQATVLVVEGEKDADALTALGLVATCNSGGAGKWPDAMNRHFSGRRVVILPDNDNAGQKHADLVAGKLHGIAGSVRVLTLPGLPDKGDVSDWLATGKTRADVVAACKSAPEWTPVTTAPEAAPGQPFRHLGYSGNSYYYLPRGTEQVAEVKKGSHTSPAELMSLAPLEWWEMAYPKGKQGGADWHAAANDCMRGCERKGIYSTDRERGRGAWYDKGRAVLHLGNRLIVDGETAKIAEHDSSYIYTRQAPLEHGADATPADDNTAADIAELFEELNWHKSVHAQMLAGWCLLAPICGAMTWRPHIWITAQRGAGKSWVQDHMIQPLLGPSAMMVQGSTTEAGIRQKLKQDARPIVFDEAESEDHRSQNRMQTVIELARQSSSDSTAEIVKGTVNGNGMAFRMRSMFLLGSVNVSLSQAADESRFSVLSLATPDKSPEEIERFGLFGKRVDNTLTPAVCASMRARAYRMMPVIRANAKTFARAVAEVLGSQRLGDQVGTLIAGACAYYRSDEISLDDARAWVEGMDFSDAKESEQVSDEESCLQRILQSQVQFDSERGQLRRSLGELVAAASGSDVMHGVTKLDANDILTRYGLKLDGNYLTVANKHTELEKLLKDTPWGSGWRRIIGRIPYAHPSFDVVRFAGTRSRAVRVPLSFLE